MDFDTFVNSVVLEGMSLVSSLIPLQDAINDNNNFCIVYPNNSTNVLRRSEQELKQCVIASLLSKSITASHPFYYSIETPTKAKYRFSELEQEKRKMIIPKMGSGRSGNFDLSIYDKFHTSHLEFKFGSSASPEEIAKDLLKLRCDRGDADWCGCTRNYFIHWLDRQDNGTLEKLLPKYKRVCDSDNFKDRRYDVRIYILIKSIGGDFYNIYYYDIKDGFDVSFNNHTLDNYGLNYVGKAL